MAGKCSYGGCFDPDFTGCNYDGNPILTKCDYYGKGESTTEISSQESDTYYRIPWTGNSFGLNDLNYLSASSKPILIGITGVANAGKTSFLASLYCLLRHGHTIGKYSFAGSLTLVGWEDIAWFLSWKNNGDIQFPPHTTNNAGRVPGLLHLALKNDKGEKKDIIFTDAPGEWFNHWRNNVDSENAKGAKWIHENCNAFLLFADNEELSGGNRGTARQQITSVADRLFENIEDRPIGLIWSKSDISIKESMKHSILSHLKQNPVVHFNELETSVKEGESGVFHINILESINWIIKKLQSNVNTKPAIISHKHEDMFLSKRTING